MSLQVIEGDNDRPKKPWAFPNAFSLEPWLLRCLASSPLFRSSSIQSAMTSVLYHYYSISLLPTLCFLSLDCLCKGAYRTLFLSCLSFGRSRPRIGRIEPIENGFRFPPSRFLGCFCR